MARHPYEWLYETQSQPLKEYVLDQVAARLAKAALEFPPAIEEWHDLGARARFTPLLERARGRPRGEALRCALMLYRWELGRDVEAIDRYLTGGHHGLSGDDLETALFLWRHWTEQTLLFKEYAQEKFAWRELAALADRLEPLLLAR